MVHLQSPETIIDPYSNYTTIREKYPVCHIQNEGIWTLSRYDDVKAALKNTTLFITKYREEIVAPSWLRKECRHHLFMLTKDPPEYTAYRGLINQPFLSKSINRLKPLMRETARALTQDISQKSSIEFLEDFAYPYIGKIFCRITGLEEVNSIKDVRLFVQAVALLSHKRPDENAIRRMEDAITKQSADFIEIIRDRRENPKDDIATKLVQAKIDGKPLTEDMLINALDLLMRTGFQPTVHLLGNGILQLVNSPELCRTLIRAPELVPAFVDELLRLHSPSPLTIRHTSAPVTLHGVTIPKGAAVLMLLGAANRDPRVFSNPDQFDLCRNRKKHMAFGYGPHICVGMALSKLEAGIAFTQLLPIINRFTCPPQQELEWVYSSFVRGVQTLPVQVHSPLSG